MFCIDANIWIYYLDADTPENASVADPLNEILRDERILMPTILQMEVVHYCHLSVAYSRSIVQRFLGLEDTETPSLTSRDVSRASKLPHPTLLGRNRPRSLRVGLSRGLPFYAVDCLLAGGTYSPLTFSIPRFKRTSTGAPPSSAFCRRRRYFQPMFFAAL